MEQRIGALVARVAGLVAKNFNDHECRALVLLGGYGRGEGGVSHKNDGEHPHNILDLLLVTKLGGTLRRDALKERLDEVLAPIVRDERLGIDTGVISDIELRHAPPRVIWFDLRWGHRTILGDAGFIPSLRPLAANAIEVEDVHNLLVNRASLLVINDAILERGFPSGRNAEFVVKHMMKAIIGHGDALLFAYGRYHASYVEKQKRMREMSSIVPGLVTLYDEAADFRFEPRYTRYLGNDLLPVARGVRSILAHVHLAFERLRSGQPDCTFRNHPERVLLAKPRDGSIFATSKQFVRSWINKPHGMDVSLSLEAAVRRSHPRRLLAAVLPTVLYGPTDAANARLVQALLGASGSCQRSLRQAYLGHWAKYGDPNFQSTAKQLGLTFDTMRRCQ
jgi:hypothetical protein